MALDELPIVSEGTLECGLEKLKTDPEGYKMEFIEYVSLKNPVLGRLINASARRSSCPVDVLEMANSLLHLINYQMESDRLDNQLKSSGSD